MLTAGKKVLADRAYSSSFIRTFIEQQKATVCIPDKSNFKVTHDFDKELYKSRNIIERFFQRIKNYRHIAFRFDKLSCLLFEFCITCRFCYSLLFYQQPLKKISSDENA